MFYGFNFYVFLKEVFLSFKFKFFLIYWVLVFFLLLLNKNIFKNLLGVLIRFNFMLGRMIVLLGLILKVKKKGWLFLKL